MNIWITKLGNSPFQQNQLTEIAEKALTLHNCDNQKLFEFKSECVHYVSICPDSDRWNKKYHYEYDDNLFGYSGLVLGIGNNSIDYRKATNIRHHLIDLTDVYSIATGHFSLFNASKYEFECIVDALPASKVFYYQDSQGSCYVSNNPNLIKLFKKPDPNIRFFINYICADGTYGKETDEKEIFSLPAFGRLHWSNNDGLKINRYVHLRDIIGQNERPDVHFDQMANEYRGIAQYIKTYHKAAISQSGGYDSRIAINMFWGLDNENVQCYTFPDHPNDRILAKKVAKNHGFPLRQIKISKLPDIDQLHTFLNNNQAPFIDYNNVFGYVINDEIERIFRDHDNVQIIGLGGESYQNFTKFSCTQDSCSSKKNDEGVTDISEYWNSLELGQSSPKVQSYITLLAEHLISNEFLTSDGEEDIRINIIKHYHDTYSQIIDDPTVESYQIANVHFLFERLGNYQALKNYFITKNVDFFLPFGTKRLLQTALSCPMIYLYRNQKNSIHHQLSKRLTNGEASKINFTRGLHWEASKLQKVNYYLVAPKIQKLKHKFFNSESKFTSEIRSNFFYNNLGYYKDVIHNHQNSNLWDYLNRDQVQNLFNDSEYLYKKHSSLISKLVPLLVKGY